MLQLWTGSNAHFLRAIDPNHQLLVGNEGFWGFYSPLKSNNPSPSNNWAALTGQNFTAQNSFQNVTTAAIHYWPDTWVRLLLCPLEMTNMHAAVLIQLMTDQSHMKHGI